MPAASAFHSRVIPLEGFEPSCAPFHRGCVTVTLQQRHSFCNTGMLRKEWGEYSCIIPARGICKYTKLTTPYRIFDLEILRTRQFSAGGIRTHPGGILSPLPPTAGLRRQAIFCGTLIISICYSKGLFTICH